MVVAAVAVSLRWRNADADSPFGTDEADYVRAMAYGPIAAYFGTHERSGLSLLRDVVVEYRATGWARPFKHDWGVGDAAGLRHYHPPVGLYPVAALLSSGVADERALRKVPALTSALACVATSLLAWCLLPTLGGPPRAAAAATAGLLATLSPFHVQNGIEVGFHAAFSLFSTLALTALTVFAYSGRGLWWRAAWIAAGLSMLTVPYWVLLIPALGWVSWTVRGHVAVPRLARDAAVSLIVTLLVVWPPFLLGAGCVKAVLMYGGILLRPLAGASEGWLLMPALPHAAILALLLALAVGALASGRVRSTARPAIPVAIFVAAFALLNVRVEHLKPLYAGDAIAPAAALAAVAFLLVPARFALATLAAPAVLLAAALRVPAAPSMDWRRPMAVADRALAGQRLLVTPRPAASMIRYYLRRSEIVPDSSDRDDLRELRRKVAAGEIDAIVQVGSIPEAQGFVESAPHPSAVSGDVFAGPAHLTWWELR